MRKALIVGIDNYTSAPLKTCVNEAKTLSELLKINEDGSPNFCIELMVDPPKKITKATLKKNIIKLFDGDCDVALLYFSGHGLINSFGGFLVTPDYKKYDEGISMNDILTYANKSDVKNKIIILDCCHSGAFGVINSLSENVAVINEGVTILTASASSETALEGVFTTLLIDSLRGGAADLRGEITPGSVYAYIDQALGPWSQRPIFKTNVSKFISLRTTEPQVSSSTLRKLTSYFQKSKDEHKLDPSYEHEHVSVDKVKSLIFKDLQQLEGVGLVVPVDEEHMYYAAINSKACRLTALGRHYWRLVSEGKI